MHLLERLPLGAPHLALRDGSEPLDTLRRDTLRRGIDLLPHAVDAFGGFLVGRALLVSVPAATTTPSGVEAATTPAITPVTHLAASLRAEGRQVRFGRQARRLAWLRRRPSKP